MSHDTTPTAAAKPPMPMGENPEFDVDIRLDAGDDPGERMVLNVAFNYSSRSEILAVWASISEFDANRVLGFHPLSLPHHFVEAGIPSMQMVWAVVCRQFVLFSVQREFSFCDPVTVPPDCRSKIRMSLQVSVQ